jgi:dolichol-phosphate mannosyltransferase
MDERVTRRRQQVILIVPTFNEAPNIVPLIKAFRQVQPGIKVIVADSDSPDGTARVLESFFGDDQLVKVLKCDRKQGRGAAIVEAYKYIKENFREGIVAIADADFSHDPKDLPRLLAALEEGEIVIGSRYVKGSKIIGWPIGRRVFSALANSLARIVMGVGIRDYTNGYRVFRWAQLGNLNFSRLDADGFIMLSQELLQWHTRGANIVEVPTKFVNRLRGKSNFRLKLIVESLWVLLKLGISYRLASFRRRV